MEKGEIPSLIGSDFFRVLKVSIVHASLVQLMAMLESNVSACCWIAVPTLVELKIFMRNWMPLLLTKAVLSSVDSESWLV